MFELHVYNFRLNLKKKNHAHDAVKLVMNTRTYNSSEYNFLFCLLYLVISLQK